MPTVTLSPLPVLGDDPETLDADDVAGLLEPDDQTPPAPSAVPSVAPSVATGAAAHPVPSAVPSAVARVAGGVAADPWAAWFDRLPDDLVLAICRVDGGRIQGRPAESLAVAAARPGGWRDAEVARGWIAERLGPGSYRLVPRAAGDSRKHPAYDSRPLDVRGAGEPAAPPVESPPAPAPAPPVDPLALRRLEIAYEERRAAAAASSRAEELRLQLALEEARSQREAAARTAAEERQERLAAEASRRAEVEEARREARAIQDRLIEVLAKPAAPAPAVLPGLAELLGMQAQAMASQMKMMNDAMGMITETQAKLAQARATSEGGGGLIDREVLIEGFRTARTLLVERKAKRDDQPAAAPAAPIVLPAPAPVLRHQVPATGPTPGTSTAAAPSPGTAAPLVTATGGEPPPVSAPAMVPPSARPMDATGGTSIPSAAHRELRRGQAFLFHLRAIQTGEAPDDDASLDEALALLPGTVAAALGSGLVERVAESLRPALESDPVLAAWFNDGDGVVVWLLDYGERLRAELEAEAADEVTSEEAPADEEALG